MQDEAKKVDNLIDKIKKVYLKLNGSIRRVNRNARLDMINIGQITNSMLKIECGFISYSQKECLQGETKDLNIMRYRPF